MAAINYSVFVDEPTPLSEQEMVFFNYSTMQMAAKVVYYGPALAGKTTNLHYIYGHTSTESRGELSSLETETDRFLFFDLLPIGDTSIAGFNTRIQLYTVPGQVFYNTTRKLVLKGVDGVVFVADSQRAMLQANIDSFRNLEENLAEMGLAVDTLPLVLQYNKRDLPKICTADELNAALNRRDWPHFEASAIAGKGVLETFHEISRHTLMSLKKRLGQSAKPAAASQPLPAQRVSGKSSASTPPQATAQPSPETGPQEAAGGKSKSSRDYAAELENLAQTFSRRKTNSARADLAASEARREEPARALTSSPPAGAEGGIFICYRRSDSMDVAGRMHDRLVARYSRDRVFKDVDSIPLGVDFRRVLEKAMTQASIVVVVIGRSWLRGEEKPRAKSANLLADPRDFVRIEVELALRLNLPIIPVLVRGAKMPSERDLPESLADLAYRNGMELRPDPDFHQDMNRLIAGMDSLLKAMRPSGR